MAKTKKKKLETVPEDHPLAGDIEMPAEEVGEGAPVEHHEYGSDAPAEGEGLNVPKAVEKPPRQKPKFEQPGTNNQSRTVENE
jgi:hypothetical protein